MEEGFRFKSVKIFYVVDGSQKIFEYIIIMSPWHIHTQIIERFSEKGVVRREELSY